MTNKLNFKILCSVTQVLTLSSITNFEFIFLLVYQYLSHLSGITVQLQSTTVDIIEAYALINATKEVYQKERERRWRKDLRPTATSLLTSVPAIICARHVENDNAIEVYGEDLPSPELVPQKIIQWKLRYEKLPTDKRPSTVAAAIKECDPHYFPNIRIPQFTSSLWAWLPPP